MGAIKKLTHDDIVERELAIGRAEREGNRFPDAAIIADRRQRWADYVSKMPEQDWLTEWVGAMEAEHGPTVQVHRVTGLNWVTALLIVRYGEAEYHWPDDGVLTEKDRSCATAWLQYRHHPYGVRYEKRAG